MVKGAEECADHFCILFNKNVIKLSVIKLYSNFICPLHLLAFSISIIYIYLRYNLQRPFKYSRCSKLRQ